MRRTTIPEGIRSRRLMIAMLARRVRHEEEQSGLEFRRVETNGLVSEGTSSTSSETPSTSDLLVSKTLLVRAHSQEITQSCQTSPAHTDFPMPLLHLLSSLGSAQPMNLMRDDDYPKEHINRSENDPNFVFLLLRCLLLEAIFLQITVAHLPQIYPSSKR